jgi:D-glycero-D-manno-heptose 1,7-bisphosphate phosphatase
MILRAARELDLELSESLLVGDKSSDILAGRAAGVRRMFKVGDPLSLRHAAADAETVSALSEVPGRLTTLAT